MGFEGASPSEGLKGASRRLEAFSAEGGLEEGLKGASSSEGLKGA